jgi:phage/plasmid primase-like uncharacterized protein
MCRCPAHDDKRPSLHVSEGRNGKVLVKCHAGCSQQAIIEALRARGHWGSNDGKPTTKPKPKAADDDRSPGEKEYERFRRGFAILRAAASDAAQPTAYLQGRGITQVPTNAMLLSAARARQLGLKPFPAMVLPITDHVGKLRGAHVTSLSKDGTAKLDTDKPKLMFGPVKGGYVQLGEPDPDRPLIICEGIESALSAAQIAGLPAIAALSAGNLEKVTPPPCSEAIIAADNDVPGRNAARRLARRLISPERVVRTICLVLVGMTTTMSCEMVATSSRSAIRCLPPSDGSGVASSR